MPEETSSNGRHVLLSTLSFAVCFAAWGLISAFAPRFREQFGLSATQTAFLVAVPVLLGALARIPVGLLADRFGGRWVFSILMLVVAVPAWLVPGATTYRSLLVVAFFLGLAGSSFPVGVGYVSRWTPPARQAATAPRLRPSETRACLHSGRFGVELTWKKGNGETGPGIVAVPTSASASLFSLIVPDNWSALVKLQDGCAATAKCWVYSARATSKSRSAFVTL
ncbi:MAG: MFS transporter [Acidobacteriota bacterium]